MDNLITVEIDGRKHRLSPRAIELLKIKTKDIVKKEPPIEIKMMPIKQEIIKIQGTIGEAIQLNNDLPPIKATRRRRSKNAVRTEE